MFTASFDFPAIVRVNNELCITGISFVDFTNNFDDSHTFAKQAMELMTEHKVPASPQNYEIWFIYAAGRNPGLNTAIDVIIGNDRQFTQEVSDEIYDHHFGSSEKMADSYREIGDRMQAELDDVIGSVENALKDASAYGSTLEDASDQMEKVESERSLTSIIGNLVKATRQMKERSETLENQLDASTKQVKTLQTDLEGIRQEAVTDKLTGLSNRKAFDDSLRETVTEVMETGDNLCLLFMDIDHFKKFNDTWGHQAGDNVLRLVANCLKVNVKGRDVAARYGGEEFAVILPQTRLSDSLKLAEQIRVAINSKKLRRKSTGEDLGTVTISIGAACFRPGEPINDFVHRADVCLYAAKRIGRNRVIGEDSDELSIVEDMQQGAA